VFVSDAVCPPPIIVAVPMLEPCVQFRRDALVEAASVVLDVIDSGGMDVTPAVALLEIRTPGSSLAARVAAVEGVVVGSRAQLHRDSVRSRQGSLDMSFADAVAATLPASLFDSPASPDPVGGLSNVFPHAVVVPASRPSSASVDVRDSEYDALLSVLADLSEG
jgi:hypothetical protein